MPLLNYDILTHVISQLSTYDALSISTTCKSLYTIVIRETLSSVHLATCEEIAKFPGFIFADPSKRIPLLQSLSFEEELLTTQANRAFYSRDIAPDAHLFLENLAAFLAQILTQSQHLRVLSLPISGPLFTKSPELGDALAANKSLVELTLCASDWETLQALSNMQSSSLRVLSLEYPRPFPEGHPPFDFSWLTKHRQLEELTLISPPGVGEWDQSKKDKWPSLRSLGISGPLPMTPFVSAFPNISSLRMEWLQIDADYEESAAQWSFLDHVIQPPDADFCPWPIRCPVRWLEFWGPVHRDHDTKAGPSPKHATTFEAVKRVEPVILTMSVYFQVNPEFWEEFARVTRDVKLLELTIYHGGECKYMTRWLVSTF